MKNSTTVARVARSVDRWRTAATTHLPAGDESAAAWPRPAGQVRAGDHRVPRRVVVVGGGFGGLGVLRHLEARLPAAAADLELVSPVDHLLYTSLLPQVCAGDVEPRHLAVSVRQALHRTVLRLGHATEVDVDGRALTVVDNFGGRTQLGWDQLVLAPGSVTKTLDIPGLAEHALGMKNLAEAVYLRDHVLRQLEYADACADPDLRRASLTFVVVGAGYTGTEVAAQLQRFTARAVESFPRLRREDVRWLLLDLASRVLPELAEPLGEGAEKVLRDRGVEVRLETSLKEVTADRVTLSNGQTLDCRTVVWCTGVTPDPLVQTVGTDTVKGRLVVDEYFRVPGAEGVFALGDAAAVPDSTKQGAPAGQTAQHAVRQGAAAGRNVAAALGFGRQAPYRHHDLGFVVDLGGRDAVANPLGRTVSGTGAAMFTRAYHLWALGASTNRARVAADWLLAAIAPEQVTQLGFLPPGEAKIAAAEDIDVYSR